MTHLRTPAIFLCATLIAITASAQQQPGNEALQSVAEQVAKEISNVKVDPAMYTPAFQVDVPPQKLAAIFKSLRDSFGGISHVILESSDGSARGRFTFTCKQVQMSVNLSIEPAPPHRVVSLWIGPPQPRMQSLDELTAQLAKLPGQVSFQIQCLDDGSVLASYQPDKPLAIGSTFKLYILATLMREEIDWSRVVLLQDRLKSLPSGEMQNWPDGSPVTVHTLALKMISISDNTAADHLLALATPSAVQAGLGDLGMKNPAADIPFLSTRELFTLKSDPDLRQKYLAADTAGRETLLGQIASRPLPTLAQLESPSPMMIDQLEWFASAADLCRLMKWYDQQQNPTVMSILAINPILPLSSDKFPYIGAKGGSEPGVLSMTWLLHASDGKHYALSGTWNNPRQDVNLQQFSDLMLSATDLMNFGSFSPLPKQ